MKTFSDIVESNIAVDLAELNGYKDGYLMDAGLAKDAGYDNVADAYLAAVLNLELCIQVLDTIPSMIRRV